MRVFAFFHLNLAFSSIENEQRPEVIQRCYWPLLRLATSHRVPLGIEASAYTLERINEIDPSWITELKTLLPDGTAEFIGSGYAQVIGPLVPARVTAANLQLGLEAYEDLLGIRPKIALVNEQAYSAGLVPLYLDAGYEAIIMEWDNAYARHPEWQSEWRYLPQYALGPDGRSIALIWNKSVPFQKFQRFAHGEIEMDEYLRYLHGHVSKSPRAFPLYGNDVEIFDFRPGRFETEAPLLSGEWERIGELVKRLQADPELTFIKPSDVLELQRETGAGNTLVLEDAIQPVPVKKQEKYNLTRWAVTGREDLNINTACWQIYDALQSDSASSSDDWRDLCYLWGSDFRTHITSARWDKYQTRLQRLTQKLVSVKREAHAESRLGKARSIRHTLDRHFIVVETDVLRVTLNCRKGLALDALIFKEFSDLPLCGTLPHGYFDEIAWAADYYSGHLVFEGTGMRKVTDLEPCTPTIGWRNDRFEVTAEMSTALGPIKKIWRFEEGSPSVGLRYEISWSVAVLGSLRLGHMTLIPEPWDSSSLFYATHNGGYELEKFFLTQGRVDHGRPVSFLVSAAHAIGITEGLIELGDNRRRICVEVDKKASALVGMVTYTPVKEKFFYRLSFSAREIDDTSKATPVQSLTCSFNVGLSVAVAS